MPATGTNERRGRGPTTRRTTGRPAAPGLVPTQGGRRPAATTSPTGRTTLDLGERVTAPAVAAAPVEVAAPSPAVLAPRPARRAAHPVRRSGFLVTALCVALVGTVAAGVAVQLRADARATAWAHAEARVAADVAAREVDEAFVTATRASAAAARYDALRTAARARADRVVAAARSAADGSPHAGDATLVALHTAADAVATSAATLGSGTSPAELREVVAAVAAPQRAAVDAEAAWQAAEAARIAAERAAAEQAAAEAARRAAAAPRVTTGGGRASRAPAPAAGGSAPGAAAAPAASPWGPGVASYGVGGLGAAVNAARAANGLPALSVSGSSSLADHAAAMASAGSIWHSGSDHIVGWVQPAGDAQMIAAYLNSPGHRAWILKEGRSSVSIGAVTIDGRLYTAMRFS